jgi:hypothetical protein
MFRSNKNVIKDRVRYTLVRETLCLVSGAVHILQTTYKNRKVQLPIGSNGTRKHSFFSSVFGIRIRYFLSKKTESKGCSKFTKNSKFSFNPQKYVLSTKSKSGSKRKK